MIGADQIDGEEYGLAGEDLVDVVDVLVGSSDRVQVTKWPPFAIFLLHYIVWRCPAAAARLAYSRFEHPNSSLAVARASVFRRRTFANTGRPSVVM